MPTTTRSKEIANIWHCSCAIARSFESRDCGIALQFEARIMSMNKSVQVIMVSGLKVIVINEYTSNSAVESRTNVSIQNTTKYEDLEHAHQGENSCPSK
jgi:hypothetical protein